MWTLLFWKRATERALKTAAQAAVLAIGADQFDALHVQWLGVLGFGLGGAVLSYLTSIASAAVGDSQDPSLVTPDGRAAIATDDAGVSAVGVLVCVVLVLAALWLIAQLVS